MPRKKKLLNDDKFVQDEFETAQMIRCFLIRQDDLDFLKALLCGDPMGHALMKIIQQSLERLNHESVTCLACDHRFVNAGNKRGAPSAFGILATGYLEETISAAMTTPICERCCRTKSNNDLFNTFQKQVELMFPGARMLPGLQFHNDIAGHA